MSITRVDVPLISNAGLQSIIMLMLPNRLTANMTLFDIGYEACKRDLAEVMAKALDRDLADNPALELLKSLRRKDEV